SAVSLNQALRDTKQLIDQADKCEGLKTPEPRIKVVTGSASGFRHADFIDGWTGLPDLLDPPFETTILPDYLVLNHLFQFLRDPAAPVAGQTPRPIVVLQEANTDFGQYTIKKLANEKLAEKSEPGYAVNPADVTFFQVPFPLHISQLRASYTKEQMSRLESQGLPHSLRDLPLPTAEGDAQERGHLAVPSQDPLMTAALGDLVLNNLVTTLAQKHARHVCLVSTDPKDKIFLARVIKDRYPDVQLFTVGGDLLFTHEDYNHAMHGMIVGSTYPLYPSFQSWSDFSADQTPQRILFTHSSFEGCYNATLIHLAGRRDTKDAAQITCQMMDYGWEGSGSDTMPPIWISVVGDNGQLIPLRYVPPSDYRVTDSEGEDPLQYFF